MAKFAQKGNFCSKTEKVNNTIVLHILIILGAKFELNLTTLIFCTNLSKKGISNLKQKKLTLPLNSAYSN